MSTEKPKIILDADDELIERLENFRSTHRIKTRMAAIQRLLNEALTRYEEEAALDRRSEVRRLFTAPISFYLNNVSMRGCSRNISSCGMFIETVDSFSVGQEITLSIPLENIEKSIQVPAKVVRADAGGIGVKFIKRLDP